MSIKEGCSCIKARFVKLLEFLKKYGNLQIGFPDLVKVWKLRTKSGTKTGRTSRVFLSFPKLLSEVFAS